MCRQCQKCTNAIIAPDGVQHCQKINFQSPFKHVQWQATIVQCRWETVSHCELINRMQNFTVHLMQMYSWYVEQTRVQLPEFSFSVEFKQNVESNWESPWKVQKRKMQKIRNTAQWALRWGPLSAYISMYKEQRCKWETATDFSSHLYDTEDIHHHEQFCHTVMTRQALSYVYTLAHLALDGSLENDLLIHQKSVKAASSCAQLH